MEVGNVANTNIVISREYIPNTNANVIVTWANNANVLAFGLANGISTVVDYTGYFERIATAFETVANKMIVITDNSNTMVNLVSSINTSLVHINTSLDELSVNTNMIRANTEILANAANLLANLGNTIGITTKTVYDELYGATTYQYLIEKGGALDSTEQVSEEQQELAKQAVADYKTKLRTLL